VIATRKTAWRTADKPDDDKLTRCRWQQSSTRRRQRTHRPPTTNDQPHFVPMAAAVTVNLTEAGPPVDRPSAATPTQQPNPTTRCPTPTQPATTRQGCMNETELPAMDCRNLTARTHHVPDTAAVPAPRPKSCRSARAVKMQPPRRNDLDRAEHRHTINTAGMAATQPFPTRMSRTREWKGGLRART
jgi:hypothetical protein